ncbi:MAG: Fic family protein [bacterium]|nr:Fic family protein [bacterium]
MAGPPGKRQPYGRTIPCPGGYRAFLPAPLPPPIGWSDKIVAALSRADLAIGRLAGEGSRFPNPHLFIRSFVRREAVLSSRIEGTRTTLAELLAAEAGAKRAADSADLREVANYVAALEYGLDRLGTLPLSLRLIREIHERLMRGVRGDAATPGEFRRSQNWIGPPGCTLNEASYIPPPPDELMGCLDALERFLHDDRLPVLVQAALAHAQFQAIHPFLDGNGRVGRLLITLLLTERRVLPSPLLYLSAFFEETREAYYAHLLAITETGAWDDWLVYFLRGVHLQADDALARIGHLDILFESWRDDLGDALSPRLEEALGLFVQNPFWTVSEIGKSLGVAYTTARRAVDRLEEAGIVSPSGQSRRNRIYQAHAVLAALEAPINRDGTPPRPSTHE